MYPLTASQSRFWRGHQLHPTEPLYNMVWRFDLQFAVDPDIFQKALHATAQENEVLRAVFVDTDNGPMQQAADSSVAVQAVDLSNEIAPEATLAQLLPDWVQAPFDLRTGTMRNHLVKLAESHWVWILCQHHIVCDAQSGAVLFERVSQRYQSFSEGSHTHAPPTPNYFESAPFQATDVEPRKTTPSLLATPPYGSTSNRGARSTRIQVPFPDPTQKAFDAAITDPALRLFTPDLSKMAIYLTAYSAYLHRVTGDEQITLGLPAHNRLSETDRRTLGLFVEVLPFQVEVNPADSLLELHGKIKNNLGTFLRRARAGAIAGQDDGGISAVCNYIQARFGDFAGHPASVQWLHSGAHDAAHAIRLHVTDFVGEGRPDLSLDVHNEILEKVPGDPIAAHFSAILNAVLLAPETLIASVEMTADSSDRALLIGPKEPDGQSATVLDAFSKQAEKTPDAVALSGTGQPLSFANVDALSDQIAAGLIRQGISVGARVAIHLPRSYDFVLAALAIMKAGASFVPISAQTPFARAQRIVQDCNAAAILVGANDDKAYSSPSFNIAELTSDPVALPTVTGFDTAYVLFTSGSTGTPKGVAVAHRDFARYIQWAAETFGGRKPARYPFFSSVSFDLTLTSLFVPLITGGSVTVYPERSDPDLAVLDVFADDNVDVVKLTPSHLALACKQGHPVTQIETLVLGGENLTSQLCRTAQDVLSPNLTIINEYGPTESVVGAMHHVFDRHDDAEASVQVGKPASGMSISIRDGSLNFCPLGVTGEIVIGGRLAQGYVNAPDADDGPFLSDPAKVQGRIYKTGDLGRINHDGSVDYLGRADQQVKRGGVRLEVAEIEQIARELSGVDAAYVGFNTPDQKRQATKECRKCGLSDSVPSIRFVEDDLCAICAEFDGYKDRAQAYFRPETELETVIARAATARTGEFEAVMLLSGGKDSTYAAYRLAGHTARVLAVTLDNGYISDEAKANIQRVTQDLGWPHRYLQTDKMNQIFVDSLKTHSNVCQGCFKALYTLAFRTALTEGAPLVVTGLSRGQFFETRLTPELFRDAAPTCAQLDAMVSQARRAYHAENDALSHLLETHDLRDGAFLDRIEVLDIYRYIDVPVSEIYSFLDTQTAWVRPSDTGRSTNCLINDTGIHLHKTREGFHNYAVPYAWDVRMGHKTRSQALDELNDDIDVGKVNQILDEIGFDEPIDRPALLTAYIAGRNLKESDIWAELRAHLPREMLPDSVVILDQLPLTGNGKVDASQLPSGRKRSADIIEFTAPETPMELRLAEIVGFVLNTQRIGVTHDFFDLGIDSLTAIQIAMKANERGLTLQPISLFEHRTIRSLANHADGVIPSEEVSDEEPTLIDLDDDDLSAIARALD
ncbi:MAG: amino acid adenylation domain-containing protein [Ruegeria sp.]